MPVSWLVGHENRELRKPYREFVVPAAVINKNARVKLADDDEPTVRRGLSLVLGAK